MTSPPLPTPPPPPRRRAEPPINYLITGAARGIGRHLSRTLASRGHRVFLIDVDGDELSHTLTLISRDRQPAPATATDTGRSDSSDSSPPPPPPVPGSGTPREPTDLSSLPAIKTAVAEARRFFHGKLDVLINNAMTMPHTLPVSISETTAAPAADEDGAAGTREGEDGEEEEELERHWERQVAVGLSAPFHLTRLCVPMLRGDGARGKRNGCVVNVSSTRAVMAEKGHEGYSAAKAGLLGLSQSMAVTLGGKDGVRVNSLVLGWVDVAEESRAGESRRWGADLTEEDHRWHAAGRVGKGEDVMRAVDYLVESEWVTGTEVVVDGGVTRKMVYPE